MPNEERAVVVSSRPVDSLPFPLARAADKPLALAGLRVIDFTRFLAGPLCTQILADLGAEVIKIEDPETGDGTRAYKPPEIAGESPYFLGLNRNKKSIVLNLRSAAAVEVAKDLVRSADVVVENFLPGTMERFGLGYADLRAINPRFVYCAMSGYGSDSSLADQPGFDAVFQAESGFASLTGDPDRLPMRTGAPVIDIATSMNAAIAVLAALAARDRYGFGQRVEVSLFESAFNLLAYFSMNYLAGGKDPVRQGNTAPVATPLGMFETADGGAIYVSCSTQKSWETLAVAVLERPDLTSDPRFATNRLRNAHQSELMALLAEIIRTRPRDEWMERIHRERVPAGAVRSVGEALTSSAARQHAIATRVPHPSGDVVPNIASPFRFGETPVADPAAAPRLGEHQQAVLDGMLGYGPDRIAALAAAGAFASGAAESKGRAGAA